MRSGRGPRKSTLTPTVVVALAAAVLAVPLVALGLTGHDAKPFRAAIRVTRPSAYCARSDDRLHVRTGIGYGTISRALRSRYPRGRVTARFVIFKRDTRKILGRAQSTATVDYGGSGRRVAHTHDAAFGRVSSGRALRYGRGSSHCHSGTARRRLTVTVEAFARALDDVDARGVAGGSMGPSQRRTVTYRLRIHSRACAVGADDCSSEGSGIPGPVTVGDKTPESGASCATRAPGGQVESAQITEASGLAASRRNADVLWTHNDSGDSARLFAMTTAGAHLGVYNLTGASATDWEDIGTGPGPGGGDYLYVGDIGDNSTSRVNVTVYRVPEPAVSADQPPATADLPGVESVDLAYPDGPRDAETLMVDPQSADLYIVSKSDPSARIYRFPGGAWSAGSHTLTYVGSLGFGGATAGDIAPSGNEILVKDYGTIHLYARAPGADPGTALTGSGTTVPYTLEPQGEAVAFDCAGRGYFTVSEGSHQPIHYYER